MFALGLKFWVNFETFLKKQNTSSSSIFDIFDNLFLYFDKQIHILMFLLKQNKIFKYILHFYLQFTVNSNLNHKNM